MRKTVIEVCNSVRLKKSWSIHNLNLEILEDPDTAYLDKRQSSGTWPILLFFW